jgi:molybdopterin-guanine dinucleotide biosynthesis protein A
VLTATKSRPLGAVLVGGASRRMGAPKQGLRWRGRTLLDHVRSALLPAVSDVLLLGAENLPDAPDARGPLAGVLSALRSRPEVGWIISACDMPWLSTDAIRWLAAQRGSGAAAILVRGPGGAIEPFPGLYEPGVRGLVECLARGGLGPSALAGRPRVRVLAPPGGLAHAWRSVNTPREFAQLTARG